MGDATASVPSLMAGRGVTHVVAYPSAAIDRTVRLIHLHPSLRLMFGVSEMHAAWTALAMAEVGRQRTTVVVPAAFSLPALGPIVAAAIEQHIPVDLLCLGTDPLGTPLPAWWPVVSIDDYGNAPGSTLDGPVVVVDRAHPSEPTTATPTITMPTATDVTDVSAEWLAHQRAAGRAVVVAVPPVLHPWRGRLEQVAIEWSLPVVTSGGADPFTSEHPELWLGRTGFVPSPAALALLGEPDHATLITAPGARLPSWIGSRPATAPAAPTPPPAAAPASAAPGQPSPALAAVTELADHFPAAWFVADAGAAHRYVAGAVANAGRPTLLTDGLTHMGWSLPTTLGAALAAPERTWVTVLGDGAALIDGTALAALAQHQVPAVVLLLDNGTLGARYADPADLRDRARLPLVDWVAFGASLGVEGVRWRPGLERVPAGADRALAERRPFLLVVATPPSHADVERFPIIIDDVDALLALADTDSNLTDTDTDTT